MEINDHAKGLYRKYEIRRTDGSSEPGGKHDMCAYFVLDLRHDTFSVPALRAYAVACAEEFPALAADLLRIVESADAGEVAAMLLSPAPGKGGGA